MLGQFKLLQVDQISEGVGCNGRDEVVVDLPANRSSVIGHAMGECLQNLDGGAVLEHAPGSSGDEVAGEPQSLQMRFAGEPVTLQVNNLVVVKEQLLKAGQTLKVDSSWLGQVVATEVEVGQRRGKFKEVEVLIIELVV